MDLLARDVMVRDVGVVDIGEDLEGLERSFAEAGVSGFPVVDGGTVVGVVSRADVVQALAGRVTSEGRFPLFYVELGAFEAEGLLDTLAEMSAGGAEPADLRVADVMSPRIIAVEPDAPLQEVARTLSAHRVHRALVIDGGRLVGIISTLDIVRLLAEGKLAPSR